MLKMFTAIPRQDCEIEPHSWDKGEKYQLVEYSGYYRLASNEGATNVVRGQRTVLDAHFDITEGWE
jgi:hypothetical protein